MRKQAIGLCIFLLCSAGLLAYFYEEPNPVPANRSPSVAKATPSEESAAVSSGAISITLPGPAVPSNTATNRTASAPPIAQPTNGPATIARSAPVAEKPANPKETTVPASEKRALASAGTPVAPTNTVAGATRPDAIPAEVADLPAVPEAKPENGASLPIFSSGPSDSKRIAITFDDGPHPNFTYKILDELRARDVKATFFVIGSNAKRYPWIVQQIAAEGHELGNHTFSHCILSRLSSEKLDEEINRCQGVIKEAVGREPTLFRPPYGIYRSHARAITQQHRLNIILWSVDPRDWRVHDEERIYQSVTNHVRNGSIILCHDIHSATIRALPRILDTLQGEGYKFTTVSELCGLTSAEKKTDPAASSR